MSGDKIVLLDGVGSGSSDATTGLLSMIPGLFANVMGGNKMDPNLVAALMNGRENKDSFGGSGCWWMWILLLFFLFGNRGFGNFGGVNPLEAGLPAQLNGDAGRELLMQAIQGNRSAIEQIASTLNCSTARLSDSICSIQRSIDQVSGQVGMSTQSIINAIQAQGCEIGNKISSCCCNLSNLINQNGSETRHMITQQGYENRLATADQTRVLQDYVGNGFERNREKADSQFNILSAKLDAQTQMISQQFCDLEKRTLQNEINALREQKQTLEFAASQQAQTANLINQLRPCPVPAFNVCNPWGTFNNGYGCCCPNGANV